MIWSAAYYLGRLKPDKFAGLMYANSTSVSKIFSLHMSVIGHYVISFHTVMYDTSMSSFIYLGTAYFMSFFGTSCLVFILSPPVYLRLKVH